MKKLFLFGMLLVVILSVAVMAEEDGWIINPANNHYYKLTEPMSWMDAEAQAEEWGAHLATVNDAGENAWLASTFEYLNSFWIGFNDIDEEGTWVWTNGEPVAYTNWAEGEPNNFCGIPDCWGAPENAAAMFQHLGFQWNDIPENSNYLRGVVEKDFLSCDDVSPVSPLENLALNPYRSGFPHPLESDRGWGGGADKWDIVDGIRQEPAWNNGLAFTGGRRPYIESCGWRQATINFGVERTFNKIVVWHHGRTGHVPNVYKIQYWNGSSWVDIFSTTNGHDYLKYTYPIDPPRCWWHSFSTPTENTFPPVTSSKIRFKLHNCDITHGWIYELEVYGPQASINQPPIAICKDIEIPMDENCQASITGEDIDGGSSDPDEGDSITLLVDNTGPFTIGTHSVTLTVTDQSGESDKCDAFVTVIDNTPPEIFVSEQICEQVGNGKGKMANKITVVGWDNCAEDALIVTIDKVEVFNNSGNLVKGNGIFDVMGKVVYVYPNGNGWSVKITATATDEEGNFQQLELGPVMLIKCKK